MASSSSSMTKVNTEKMTKVTPKESCSICCETYSPIKRKKVTCFQCEGDACVQCVKKYLLGTFDDAHCMFCRFHWSREFLDTHLSLHFRTKEYKTHRENILCEREKSRLPETQALYETVKERQKNLTEEQEELKNQIKELENQYKRLSLEYERKIHDRKFVVDQRTRQKYRLEMVLRGHSNEVPEDAQFAIDTIEKAKNIMFPCPTVGCNALLDSKLNCMQCKVKLCRSCHVIKQENVDHVCSPDDVATIKQLKKDSKNCPGCGSMIHKIDGCDQMWCTMCHTAFSWRTGDKIERGQIHNPHFYEWKRKNGGLTPGAVDADGCPVGLVTIDRVTTKIRTLTGSIPSRVVYDIHRELAEINDLYINHREVPLVDPNRYLRVLFIEGKITEAEWKHELQKNEKREMKTFETTLVFQMYVGVMQDLFREISQANSVDDLARIKESMVRLIKYVYQNLVQINTRYGSVAAPQYARHADLLEEDTFCFAIIKIKSIR